MDNLDAVPEKARQLHAFVGSWDVEGEMVAGEDRQSIGGHWEFEVAADGWGVTGTLSTDIEGMGRIDECELIGFDASTELVHMVSMNRLAIRDHIGEWEEDTLVTRFRSDDRGSTVEEIRVRFPDPDRMDASVAEYEARQLVLTTQLTLRRRTT